MGNKAEGGLPENARRELKPGESYTPIITGLRGVAEVTLRSVVFGLPWVTTAIPIPESSVMAETNLYRLLDRK